MEAARRADLLVAVEEETVRLSRFVSNLLDMTRVEAGPLDLKRDWMDVEEVTAAAAGARPQGLPVEVARPRHRRRPAARARRRRPVRAGAVQHPRQCRQVQRSRTATLLQVRQDHDTVTIAVEDRGRGIPPGDLGLVFGKFTRLGGGDGRPAGTGLGSPSPRGSSTPWGRDPCRESAAGGRGARIVIRLPVPEGETERAGSGPRGGPGMTGSHYILVVDDEPQIQRFLRPTLVAAGYAVEAALTGAEALRIAPAPRPTSCCSTSACPTWTGSTSCGASAPSRRCRL